MLVREGWCTGFGSRTAGRGRGVGDGRGSAMINAPEGRAQGPARGESLMRYSPIAGLGYLVVQTAEVDEWRSYATNLLGLMPSKLPLPDGSCRVPNG